MVLVYAETSTLWTIFLIISSEIYGRPVNRCLGNKETKKTQCSIVVECVNKLSYLNNATLDT